jgi:putative oxidoreductase
MLFPGVDKILNGLDGIRLELAGHGLPPVMAWGVYAGEIVAPLLILGGLWTPPAAMLYAATILFATVLVHADSFARLLPTGAWAAETDALYILGAVSVSLLGAGCYSIRRGGAYLIPPTVPFLANVAISTAVPVVTLTWCVMPGITRLLYSWLYAARTAERLDG